MIVMVNGPFGVGKTTVAQALCAATPNAMLYDPEIVGTALRYVTAGVVSQAEQTDDFQDIALWPSLTVRRHGRGAALWHIFPVLPTRSFAIMYRPTSERRRW
jgi:cytidylate kinase